MQPNGFCECGCGKPTIVSKLLVDAAAAVRKHFNGVQSCKLEIVPGQSIGRYGDVGDYTPSNCDWMSWEEQMAEAAKKREQ